MRRRLISVAAGVTVLILSAQVAMAAHRPEVPDNTLDVAQVARLARQLDGARETPLELARGPHGYGRYRGHYGPYYGPPRPVYYGPAYRVYRPGYYPYGGGYRSGCRNPGYGYRGYGYGRSGFGVYLRF